MGGKQLGKKTHVEIEINGKKLKVDYRIISIEEKEMKDADPVMLFTGFGSGWEGIAELGFSLACEGRKVILCSLPGYGNSDEPPVEYLNKASYFPEAEATKKILDALEENEALDSKPIHMIGHSTGSEIIAEFAAQYPDKVSSLVLLNPSGVKEKESLKLLGIKFATSGIVTDREFVCRKFFSGEKYYEDELKKYVPKFKSPFSKDRRKQRRTEIDKLAKGHLMENLNKSKVPITLISGELDWVNPPGELSEKDSQITKIIEGLENKTRLEESIMKGLRHNTTIAPDEITAANIEHYLEKIEFERKIFGKSLSEYIMRDRGINSELNVYNPDLYIERAISRANKIISENKNMSPEEVKRIIDETDLKEAEIELVHKKR